MKYLCGILPIFLSLLFAEGARAETFESIDECQSLRHEITAAMDNARGLGNLMTSNTQTAEDYLSQLYEGVKILTKTGESFFKAADEYESACRLKLKQANKLEEIRAIYDWYLEPSQAAFQFFRRAREVAIRLNRQADVDTLNTIMTEYDDAMMKLVSVCQSDLADTQYADTCTHFSARLAETLSQK